MFPFYEETSLVKDLRAYVSGTKSLSNLILDLSLPSPLKSLSKSNLILFHLYIFPVVNYSLYNTPLIESYNVFMLNSAISYEISVIFKSLN